MLRGEVRQRALLRLLAEAALVLALAKPTTVGVLSRKLSGEMCRNQGLRRVI